MSYIFCILLYGIFTRFQQVFKVKQKEGLTFEQTSKRFGIPRRTLFRWQLSIAPKTRGNKPATKIDKVLLSLIKGTIPGSWKEFTRKLPIETSAT